MQITEGLVEGPVEIDLEDDDEVELDLEDDDDDDDEEEEELDEDLGLDVDVVGRVGGSLIVSDVGGVILGASGMINDMRRA